MGSMETNTTNTTLTADELTEARAWLSECAWADCTEEDFARMPDAKIVRGIARHFDGGIAGFKAAC